MRQGFCPGRDPPSQASGLSHESPRPGRSSPSKTINEDMAIMKGQIAPMQGAIMKLLSLPALKPVSLLDEGRKD